MSNLIKNQNPNFNLKSDVKIVFRNQQLLNLWENEMSGQISDGNWENSRNTSWIWNASTELGDETKVIVANEFVVGKKSFPMSKFLWEIIGDRILEENGFDTEKSAKSAWKEINNAIKEYITDDSFYKELKVKRDKQQKLEEKKIEEFSKRLVDELNFDPEYTFSYRLKYEGGYFKIDPSKYKRGYVVVEFDIYSKDYMISNIKSNSLKTIEDVERFIETTKAYITMLDC